MEKLVEKLKILITNNESQTALRLLRQGLLENEVELLKKIKAKGIFRCSSYNFEVKTLQILIDNITTINTLTEESISYLNSVKSILFAGREVKKIIKKSAILILKILRGLLKIFLNNIVQKGYSFVQVFSTEMSLSPK